MVKALSVHHEHHKWRQFPSIKEQKQTKSTQQKKISETFLVEQASLFSSLFISHLFNFGGVICVWKRQENTMNNVLWNFLNTSTCSEPWKYDFFSPNFYIKKRETNTELTALKIHNTFLTQILYLHQYNSGATQIKSMGI